MKKSFIILFLLIVIPPLLTASVRANQNTLLMEIGVEDVDQDLGVLRTRYFNTYITLYEARPVRIYLFYRDPNMRGDFFGGDSTFKEEARVQFWGVSLLSPPEQGASFREWPLAVAGEFPSDKYSLNFLIGLNATTKFSDVSIDIRLTDTLRRKWNVSREFFPVKATSDSFSALQVDYGKFKYELDKCTDFYGLRVVFSRNEGEIRSLNTYWYIAAGLATVIVAIVVFLSKKLTPKEVVPICITVAGFASERWWSLQPYLPRPRIHMIENVYVFEILGTIVWSAVIIILRRKEEKRGGEPIGPTKPDRPSIVLKEVQEPGRKIVMIELYDEAMRYADGMSRLLLDRSSPEVAEIGAAISSVLKGEYDEADSKATAAIKLLEGYSVNNPIALLCQAYLIKGDVEFNRHFVAEAGKYYDLSHGLASQINDDFLMTASSHGIAVVEASQGKHEEALKMFESILQRHSEYFQVFYNKGVALDSLKRYEEAIPALEEAIRLNPTYAPAWNNKGAALGKLDRHEDALHAIDESIRLNPNYSIAWNNKGVALGRLDRHEEALDAFDKATRLNPNYAIAWSNLGSALGILDRYDEAYLALNRALQIDPNNEQAKNAKKLIEEKMKLREVKNSAAKREMARDGSSSWDLFICHANEDKDEIARPLASSLRAKGLRVWYDEFALTLGDSLSRSIDHGLANSRFGIVILSPSFFQKEWPRRELDGLTAKEISSGKAILPVWHNVDRDYVLKYSPTLADKVAVSTNQGLNRVVAEILMALDKDKRSKDHGQKGTTEIGEFPRIDVNLWQQANLPGRGLQRNSLPHVGTMFINHDKNLLKLSIVATVFLGKEQIDGVTGDIHGYYSGRTPIEVIPNTMFWGNFGIQDRCVASSEILRVQLDIQATDERGKKYKPLYYCYTYDRKNNEWFLEPTRCRDLIDRT